MQPRRRGQETLKAGYLFVFIGAAPRTEWLDGVVARRLEGSCSDRSGPDRRRAAGHGAGASTATRTSSSPASRACSPPATSGPTR